MPIARYLLSAGFAVAIPAVAPPAMGQVTSPGPRSTLVGIVVDSIHGGPLAGANVLLDGTTMSTITDTTGAFRLEGIVPGEYRIAVFHPLLDRLGIGIGTVPLRMGPDSVRRITLGTPSGRTLVERSCTPASLRRGAGALMGRVEHPDTRAPLGGVRVSMVWTETEVSAAGGVRRTPVLRSATTDAAGMYVICGLPDGIRATVQAELGAAKSAEVPIEVGGSLSLQDFALSPDVAADGAPLVGTAVLTGRVLDQSGSAVDGAGITVQGAGASGITDSTGEFRITRLPSGTRSVGVRKIGYAPAQIAVDLRATTAATVTVRLEKAAQALATVEVVGKLEAALEKTGFLDRKRQGLGRYMTEEDIRPRKPRLFSDLFQAYPGFRVERGMGGNAIRATRGGNGCVTFWVDRVQHRETQPGEMDSYLPPEQVMAIETYTATAAPLGFTDSRDSSCAVIIVWTNRTVR